MSDYSSDQTARFSNLELDDTVPPVAPAPPPAPIVRGVTIDAEGAQRATEDGDAANAAGFSVAPPVYTIGTMVVDMGVQNFRQSRKDFEDLPRVGEACADLALVVANEKREDHLVRATGLRMLQNGQLLVANKDVYPLTKRGVEGLAQFTTPGGAGYLKECPPDLRAYNFNQWLPKALREDKRATNARRKELMEQHEARVKVLGEEAAGPFVGPEPVMIPKDVTLRTRNNPRSGGREVFTVVGPRYGAFDIDKIAEQVAQGVPDDARCDITYDGYRARINVLFHTNIKPEKAVAGEMFKAGLLITTADDGSGSIKISAQVWRNLCLNLIIIDFKKLLVGSRRHMGQTGDIAQDVKLHMETAMGKIGYFADKWSEANLENVLERYGLDNMEALFTGLVKNRVVAVPGVRPDDMVEKLMTAFEYEPFATKAGVLNAITRVAHTESWKSPWTTEDLEETAGELLFQKQAWSVATEEENPFGDLA